MAVVRALVRFANDDALPENAFINTWHFNTPPGAVDAAACAVIGNAIETFYTSFDEFLSSVLSGDVEVRYYNLADAEPRTPILTESFVVTPGSNPPLPSEVAVRLSAHASLPSGSIHARRRGGVYIGPLDGGAKNTVLGKPRPVAGFLTALADAATALINAGSDATFRWAIHSETGGGDNAVIGGWVDNAFDIIRKRGEQPTARTTY